MKKLGFGAVFAMVLFSISCGKMDQRTAEALSKYTPYKITVSVDIDGQLDPVLFIKAYNVEMSPKKGEITLKGVSYISDYDNSWSYVIAITDAKISVPPEGTIKIERMTRN